MEEGIGKQRVRNAKEQKNQQRNAENVIWQKAKKKPHPKPEKPNPTTPPPRACLVWHSFFLKLVLIFITGEMPAGAAGSCLTSVKNGFEEGSLGGRRPHGEKGVGEE